MKKTITICSLIIGFISCTQIRDNEIDFSFESGWDNEWAFSIKIEKTGKAFLARNRNVTIDSIVFYKSASDVWNLPTPIKNVKKR